ncbi:hypothetical protein BDEG_25878 [Batrachochytrium dendrobatidis JEL423]|uniref:Integrase catalytic domain-containing protein n=1 Tax=Batrachochytrium dendrobatidis (strain JEL423) TaxID=403673 RepID=A0A177WQM9_BATDL|nr:hypothetical protein BDEG_25878 [Batrachochytrium dendrobatidis JEL423]
MNFLKHETVKIVGQDTYNKNVRRNNYLGHQDLVEGYEFRFNRSDFQYCIMDTDSAYFAISGDSLQDVVKPHLFNEFQQQKKYWFGRDDTPANKLYDSRTPGLFKLEYKGDCVISLASKMHYCDEKKFSSKGISKNQNEITKQKYLNALSGNGGQEFINNGFRTGFTSAEKLYRKLNKEIPLSQIKTFLQQQEVYQLHRQQRKVPVYSPITVYSINDQWQIDLIDLSRYAKWNSGYKYLLCVIDVFSRRTFVVAMKKSDSTEAMKKVFDIETPILIQSDSGTEFLNGAFQRLLTSKGVRHITVEVGDHKRQGIIERFNRTLENIIALYQEARRTNTYIDVLEDIVYNYNHTYHRGINGIPQQLYLGNPSTGTMNVKIKKNAISVGDKVRLLKTRQAFRKGYEPKYSHTIYKVISGNGYSYFIADDDDREPRMTNMERRNKRELEELVSSRVTKRTFTVLRIEIRIHQKNKNN